MVKLMMRWCAVVLCTAALGEINFLYPMHPDVEASQKDFHAQTVEGIQQGAIGALYMYREVGGDLEYSDEHGWTFMHHAAASGQEAIVRYLRASGASLESKTENGDRALHIATRNNHASVVRTLVELGADRNIAGKDGKRPFYIALTTDGCAEIARYYLADVSHDVDAQVFQSMSQAEYGRGVECGLLFLACANGDVPLLERFARRGAIDCNLDWSHGFGYVHVAAVRGQLDALKFLYTMGADFNQIADRYQMNLVHCACVMPNQYELLKYILGCGVPRHLKNSSGLGPLDMAARHDDLDAVKMITIADGPLSASMFQKLKVFLSQDYCKSYPGVARWARMYGSREIYGYLRYQAVPTRFLMHALEVNDSKIAEKAIIDGADVTASFFQWHDNQPLHMAARCGNVSTTMSLLLANPCLKKCKRSPHIFRQLADMTALNGLGENPVQVAIKADKWEWVESMCLLAKKLKLVAAQERSKQNALKGVVHEYP